MTTATKPFPRRRDGYYHYADRKYVSVTKVNSTLAKDALVPWAAKTAAGLVLGNPELYDTAEKAAAGIYQARDKAADRGSMVHSLAEALLRGAEIVTDDLPPNVHGYALAFRGWVNLAHPLVLFTEANVYSDKHGYAGTTDLIARLPDGLTWMLDIKTGRAVYDEAHLQLIAYKSADFILTRDDPPKREPLPTIDRTAVLLLNEDGTHSLTETSAPLEIFLALKQVHEWRGGRGH